MKIQIEWIPVERELPPGGSPPQFCLIANRQGFVRQAEWTNRQGFVIRGRQLESVTHWAHLPEHPAQLEKSK